MFKTLYFHGYAADQATESFERNTPITILGIDPYDGRMTTLTGIVSVLEFSPWATRHDGRQWRATLRGG
jgi:hypothetical protein